MLKKLGRLAKNMECILDTLPNSKDLVEIELDINNAATSALVDSIWKIYLKNGLKKDKSQNPSYSTYFTPDLSSYSLSSPQKSATCLALCHAFFESEVASPPENIWFSFLGVYSSLMGALPLCITENGKRRFFLKLYANDIHVFEKDLHEVIKKCCLSLNFGVRPADGKLLHSVLKSKLGAAKDYYLASEAEWSQKFYASLGDDLSRSALLNFLRDRMRAKVFWDSDIYYTVTPTLETAAWRKQRLSTLKSWPLIDAPHKASIPFITLHTFVFEQYRVPGIIETEPGDVVIDAGAGFGDTSLYFSKRMADAGKIIALDPLPQNVEAMKNNFKRHNCKNITVIPASIGDKIQDIWLYLQGGKASTVAEIREKSMPDCLKIRQTTVDALAQDNAIDFIKADIEGAE